MIMIRIGHKKIGNLVMSLLCITLVITVLYSHLKGELRIEDTVNKAFVLCMLLGATGMTITFFAAWHKENYRVPPHFIHRFAV